MKNQFTLALPSKGAIAEPTDQFLREAGLKVNKPNPRQYVGTIPSIPSLNVLFQRVKDVAYKVADGTVELGISGLDVVRENAHENIVVINDRLQYGQCSLVIAVPEAWVDVETMADLSEVALSIRENQRRNLRIATTFPALTRQFFHQNHIHHFTIVKAEGAIEAAPTIGYADIIVDLTQSGTTLRENHLKPIKNGVILDSQACLIGNRQALLESEPLREVVRKLSEYIDASLNGREYTQLVVDIKGVSAEKVAELVVRSPITCGLLGPTVSPIYSPNASAGDAQWHTVTLTVRSKQLLAAVEYLRSIGGTHAIAVPVKYIFMEQSQTYTNLIKMLGL